MAKKRRFDVACPRHPIRVAEEMMLSVGGCERKPGPVFNTLIINGPYAALPKQIIDVKPLVETDENGEVSLTYGLY